MKKRKAIKNNTVDEKNRYLSFQSLFKSMENQRKAYTQGLNTIKKLKGFDHEGTDIQAEKLLKENEILLEELTRMRASIEEVVDEVCKKSELLDEERELLNNERIKIQILNSYKNDQELGSDVSDSSN